MQKTIKLFTIILIISTILLLFTNCAAIFLPKHQNILFKTNSVQNEVYLDNYLIIKGIDSVVNVNKKGVRGQITVLRKGYKPVNDVITRTRRPFAFYPLLILGMPTILLGGVVQSVDMESPKSKSFEKEIFINSIPEESKLPLKKEDEKNLNFQLPNIDKIEYGKDLIIIEATHDVKLMNNLIEAEKLYYQNKEENQKKYKLTNLNISSNSNFCNFNEEMYKSELYNNLLDTKYIDTSNNVLNDRNKTLIIEASINKITIFYIKAKWSTYYKTKLNTTWYIKNLYNETLDSVELINYSGNYFYGFRWGYVQPEYDYKNTLSVESSISDAMTYSFIELSKNKFFTNQIKLNKDFTIKENILQISKGTDDNKIVNKKDAFKATVIVKAKENNKNVGHGSGFAISKDGYVLTNYHVIAGKTANKQNEISVITATGQELPAKIVRFNKFRDVALLKIDYTFEKVFELENNNKAEVLMDVLTIGAPKSIELGQSVTTGIISNIRNENENKYLQLGMSINGGNSGGPIFDEQGNLHGIVVSKLVGYATEGVAFAIPSYMVAEYLNLEVK